MCSPSQSPCRTGFPATPPARCAGPTHRAAQSQRQSRTGRQAASPAAPQASEASRTKQPSTNISHPPTSILRKPTDAESRGAARAKPNSATKAARAKDLPRWRTCRALGRLCVQIVIKKQSHDAEHEDERHFAGDDQVRPGKQVEVEQRPRMPSLGPNQRGESNDRHCRRNNRCLRQGANAGERAQPQNERHHEHGEQADTNQYDASAFAETGVPATLRA